jgi:hypothetical protein
MKASSKILLFIFAACPAINFSCKKLIEIDAPRDQLTAVTVFSSDNTATAAMVGLYSQLMNLNNNFGNSATSIYAGLSADEIYNTATSSEVQQFRLNTLASTNATMRSIFWQRVYGYIYQDNAIIEGLNTSTTINPSLKKQLLGEAKFMRAFFYFYLVNLFGDVPLQLSTDYRINAVMPRSDAASVKAQITSDLLDAQQLLAANYPSAGPVRPNKWAATALLSRVYLFNKEWANAEAQATAVISSGSYSIQSDLNKVFLAGSSEAILQLLPVAPGFNTYEGFNFIPFSGIPPYGITDDLLSAFETGDQRKQNWLTFNLVGTTAYYYPFKYKVRNGGTITENYTLLRLAEQYLIRAEARAQQNNLTGATADINIIRSRAALASLPNSLTASQLLTAIEKERRIELFAEWGHRWLDLKRTNRADVVLSLLKGPNWQSTDALYPIPLNEIKLNPFLTQNPGY